jgi:type I restriction enzyme R subunit
MKPLVVSNKTTFDDIIDGFDSLETESQKENQVDILIAKMRRNKNGMSDENREKFELSTEEIELANQLVS